MAENFLTNLTSRQERLMLDCVRRLLDRDMEKAWDIIKCLIDDEGLNTVEKYPDMSWLLAEYFYRDDASDRRGRAECHECLQVNPNHPIALNLYGEMMMTDQCYDEAVNYFNRAIKFYPSDQCLWISDSVLRLQERPEVYLSRIIKCNLAEVTAKTEDPITGMKAAIARFSAERDWDQFHNGKDLAIGLSIEASELLETFLWKAPEDVDVDKVKEELADVFNYALQIATKYNLNVYDIVMDKIRRNAEKYPVDKAYGKADKYNEL